MATYRVPILVWRDVQGAYTAAPVELYLGESGLVGFADKLSSALKQVQSYLTWNLKQQPWQVPDFQDPQVVQVRVEIRPEYRTDRRVYPCPETIELQVPCVVGQQESGLLLCSIPTMGILFHFYDRKELRQLVAETVRRTLADSTPFELSLHLPPRAFRLEHVSVRMPDVSYQDNEDELYPTLLRTAQAIGRADFRKRFGHVWKRDQEIRDLAQRLSSERANVLLVGPRDAGKTSVLVQAVRLVQRNQAKDEQGGRKARFRHWQTSAGRLVAGMKYLGQWEERCEAIIEELNAIDGVLCLENLVELVQLGGTGASSSVAAFLASFVRDGQLKLVVETTLAELEACRRQLPGFVELFQVLHLRELSDGDMREAMKMAVAVYAREAKVTVGEFVADRLFQLFRRFMPYRPLPGGAVRFLKNLFDRARTDRVEDLTMAAVLGQFTRETGLPMSLLCDDQALDVDALHRHLNEQVIGQPAACGVVTDVIARFKTGLNDPGRPLAALLFCGPTGVGKTQLAKSTSQYLFGHGDKTDRLVRLDMSEYSSPSAAERLLTGSDGSVSEFLGRVRQQPFCVVLLDEIEKAAAEVYDMLLGLLDEGRLTDRYGRTTTFRNALLIMTSNLGAMRGSSIGLQPQKVPSYEREVRAFFRPEFFNRLDQVVVFHPLDETACRAIIRKELEEVPRRAGCEKRGLSVLFHESVVECLLKIGFDPLLGARPLQRTIEESVVAPLARQLADGVERHRRSVAVTMQRDGTAVLQWD